jgi:hypothetical protein
MKFGNRIILSFVLLAVAFPGNAQAALFPRYTVDAMCDKAEVIIEGLWVGGNDVRIVKVHKGSMLLEQESKSVEVSRLNQHSRTVGDGLFIDEKPLETKKLVLFLVRETKTNQWESIATIDRGGRCGSCGLFWFDDSTCYGYAQTINPGPYVLIAGERVKNAMPIWIAQTVPDLRKEIEIGLDNSRKWQLSLAIEDPAQSAASLARYLLKSSSPKGDKGTYRNRVREPLAALGKDAVPALIHILQTAPADERLDTTVLTLFDIGPPSAQALPELRALLEQPDRVHTGYVLLALGSTGDPQAVDDIKKHGKTNDERLRNDAKEALAIHRKRQTPTSSNSTK